MTITFYGGAGGVTGSKHLLEYSGKRILLDCGTFQGLSDIRARNKSLPFVPETINHVVLSHAHIDHCGMLPLLVKRGFKGSIYATRATCDVAQWMLRDMAHIEEQDTKYRKKHHYGSPSDREPLFTSDDVEETVQRFVPVEYARNKPDWTKIDEGLKLKMYDAGHILGSAVSVLEFSGSEGTRTIAYTGDMGQPGAPLLFDPQFPKEKIGTLLIESTYGSRKHEGSSDASERLATAVKTVVNRGGKMVVPAFSLGRTQLIVYLLHKLTDEGHIPRFPIYVDSPLATNLTDVYRKHRKDYDQETISDFGDEDAPLAFRNLKYTSSVDESKALNVTPGPYMVISASGMMTAGRVVHHLKNTLADKKNAVFITGYQARGTLGQRILAGATEVEIFGNKIPVEADIFLFNEFSAHADRDQLQEYAESIDGLKQLFLVHGEPHQADDFKSQLSEAHPDWQVVRPDEGDSFVIDPGN